MNEGAGRTRAPPPPRLRGLWLRGEPGSLLPEQCALERTRFRHRESRGSIFPTVLYFSFCSSSIFHTCQAPLSMDFQGKNIGVGCHSLLQGIFPTQGSNPGLPGLQPDSLLTEPLGKLIYIPTHTHIVVGKRGKSYS